MANARKRAAAVAALLVALLVLTGCEPEQPSKSDTKPRAGAGQAKPPKADPGKGAEPAPVQGDPSAHNTEEGEVDIHVSWTNPKTAVTPLCEWSKNGTSQPCAGMHEAVKEGKNYIGLWEYTTRGKSGDTFTVNAEGLSGTDPDCSIAFRGVYHEGTTRGPRCGAVFTIP